MNAPLGAATRWQLVAVPGLVPDLVFFDHLANRRFPVTWWIREEHEFAYIVEPDVFHDFFGHVPMLFDPMFADYMQAYGRGGVKAEHLGALQWLARLYWYTVEFGLIRTPQGLRNYGAGILSSPAEVEYAIRSPKPRRVLFDLRRIMRSQYRIDAYQETYFVIDSFQQLFDATGPRLHAALRRAQAARRSAGGRGAPRGPAGFLRAGGAGAKAAAPRAPARARRPRSRRGARKPRRCSAR